MPDREQPKKVTDVRPIRVPLLMWQAYGRVCDHLDTDRTKDLLDHMRAQIGRHGTDQDRADLAAAEQELTERRSRKGGRPPKTAAGSEPGSSTSA